MAEYQVGLLAPHDPFSFVDGIKKHFMSSEVLDMPFHGVGVVNGPTVMRAQARDATEDAWNELLPPRQRMGGRLGVLRASDAGIAVEAQQSVRRSFEQRLAKDGYDMLVRAWIALLAGKFRS